MSAIAILRQYESAAFGYYANMPHDAALLWSSSAWPGDNVSLRSDVVRPEFSQVVGSKEGIHRHRNAQNGVRPDHNTIAGQKHSPAHPLQKHHHTVAKLYTRSLPPSLWGMVVGIELGRVCVRRRATSLALSVARWVHNSAMATVPEAPL
jgi:hypothetical protein